MKRFVIASFIIENNKLYSYQKYLLEDIRNNADTVVLSYYDEMQDSDKNWCKEKNIELYKSNSPIDVEMWRTLITSEQYSSMYNYDEIVLCNDSVFGPLYTLKKVFEKMSERGAQFWGISVHGRMPCTDNKSAGKKIWSRFLQRYFTVFKKSLFNSGAWKEFWTGMGKISDWADADKKYEFVFTDFFQKKGYSWSAYCDTTEWEKKEPERYMSYILYRTYDMLKDKELPFISKQMFSVSKEYHLCYNCGNEGKKVIDYIKNNTDYDENFIFDFLINTKSPYEIWSGLNLTYILPENEFKPEKRNSSAVVFAHLYYEDMLNSTFEYLKRVPEWIDIIITTDTEKKYNAVKEQCEKNLKNNYKIIIVKNKGREWSAFLLNVVPYVIKYKYFCFVHDKKSEQMFYPTVGNSFNEIMWNAVLYSENYIENVINKFEEDNRLGMLAPHIVYHGEFWRHSADFWTVCYEGTRELAEKIGINDLSGMDSPLITIGSYFWGRTEAFKKLLLYNFKYEDFEDEPLAIDGTINHFLERIITFAVKDAGYYTALIIPHEYAENDIVNIRTMLQKILSKLKNEGEDITSTYSVLRNKEKTGRFFGFIRR